MSINRNTDPKIAMEIDDLEISVCVAPTGSATSGSLPAYIDFESIDELHGKVRLYSSDRDSLAQSLRELARAVEFGIKSTRQIEVTFMEG